MAAAKPLAVAHIADAETPDPFGESLVTDDRTIYHELIAPMEAAMMRSIWRVLRDADLAEDCLQDALAVIWKKRTRIRRHPNPPALVLKICLDSAYDALRRLERMRRHTDISQLDDALVRADQDTVRILERRELAERVQQAIRRLPRKRALAVMMRFIHEQSFESIAQALNCSEVTVRIHVSKGRAQLKKWLSPLCQSLPQEQEDE